MFKSDALKLSIIAIVTFGCYAVASLADEPTSIEVSVQIDANKTIRTMDPARLGGTNVAMWYFPATYHHPDVQRLVADLHSRYIRIPGGSWANGVYWNGNGVRKADGTVDPSVVGPDGYPAVDYSAYAPSFLVDTKTLHPASNGWHGHVDVKTQHDWIKSLTGTEAMACPNAGTGRAVDAAEWVKWANKTQDYNVRVWEIGNELGGSWEAGTDQPLGKGPLTAEIYTARYNEMADAMRKVDPTIKIGSCPYVEEALRDCGKNVDFVSIHTYPGSTTLSESQMFAEIPRQVKREVDPVKQWIHKYQPNRENEIEIGYSEWNLAGGIDNGRLFSGLWASIFLAEIAKNNVSMANQWDCFSDLVFEIEKGKKFVPKAEYYALWLWNNYMGDRLITSTSSNQEIYTCASRSDDAVAVMLVNTDRDRDAKVHLKLSNFKSASTGEKASVTSREYYYNALTKKMVWSRGAHIEPLAVSDEFDVSIAPFSIAYVRIPERSTPSLSAMAARADRANPTDMGKPELHFEIPHETYAGDALFGEVYAVKAGTNEPYAGTLDPASLNATIDVGFDRKQVRLTDAVGGFTIKPTTPGDLTLTAQSGDYKSSQTINVKPSIPRPLVFFDFANPLVTDHEIFSSDYSLNEDLTQRANRAVARIDLSIKKAVGDNGNGILKVSRLPEANMLNKSNIRGVIVDVKTSADFSSEDPNANIMVVMQSSANWWMKIGTIPLRDATEWKSYQLEITNEEYIKALPASLNIIFVLQSGKAVKGSIFLDKIGFMVR